METAEITALTVVFFIAAIEICCFFVCSKLRRRSYPLCTVIPVLAEDDELPQRLEYIASLIEDGRTFIGTILLIDMGGTDQQLELCREFCSVYHAAELVLPHEADRAMRRYLRNPCP